VSRAQIGTIQEWRNSLPPEAESAAALPIGEQPQNEVNRQHLPGKEEAQEGDDQDERNHLPMVGRSRSDVTE